MAYEDSLLRRPFWPVNFGERASNAIQGAINTIGGLSGGKAPMMAAGAAIPSSATLSDFRFTGPLIRSDKSRRVAVEEPNVTIADRGPAWDAPKPSNAFRPFPYVAPPPAKPAMSEDMRARIRMYELSEMSPQAQDVVFAASGQGGEINAQYSPTLPQTTLSPYSIPSVAAPQLGIGMGSQISEINRPSFQSLAGTPQPAQQLPSVTQQIPIQGRAIETPHGTLYATSEAPRGQMTQVQSFGSRSTAFEGRTPTQQQALLAKMRTQGASIMRDNIKAQEQFFAQKRAERAALSQAETVARASGATSMDIMRAREAMQPSTIAGIRAQALPFMQFGPQPASLASSAAQRFGSNLSITQPKPSGGFGISTLGTNYPSNSRRTRFIDNRYTRADSTGALSSGG
jgi:hypothetical protein